MSEAATIFKAITVEAAGRTYELPRPNLRTEAAFSRHLIKKEAAELKMQRDDLGPQIFSEVLAIHLDRCLANHFGWCRPGFLAGLDDAKSVTHFFWLWISQASAEKPKEEDIYESVRNDRKRFFALTQEVISDPSPLPAE